MIEQKANIIAETELASPETSSYDDKSSRLLLPCESTRLTPFEKKDSNELTLSKNDEKELDVNDQNLYKNVLNKKTSILHK